MQRTVLHAIDNEILLLTLNRPEKYNALNYEMIDSLLRHLDGATASDAVRAVIITGAGQVAFSAGGDIPEFTESVHQGTDAALRDFVDRGQRLTSRIEAFRKPVIAAVNGLAYGGGCEITEACHLAVAADSATFCKSEVRLGMPPTFGGTQRLPRTIGRKAALEFLLTGEVITAQRALALGLVNRLAPREAVLETAIHFARSILSHSAGAVGAILHAATRGQNMGIAEGLLVEREQFARISGSPEHLAALDGWAGRSRDAAGSPQLRSDTPPRP